jgi:hypothetical protein
MEELLIEPDDKFRFTLNKNNKLDDDISKILLVHDGDSVENRDLTNFLAEQGYEVVTLHLADNLYQSIGEFVPEFERFVKTQGQEYVWVIVHYAQTKVNDVCMYCNESVPKHGLLLKQAFATLYVHLGRERCTLVCPPRCCDNATSHLPRKQIEGMVIYTEDEDENCLSASTAAVDSGGVGVYPPFVWGKLQDKLTTIRLIDSHKPEQRHRRNLVEEVPEVTEEPLTEEQVMRLITLILTYFEQGLAEKFATQVGITSMEWEEYVKRSGDQTLYLVLRRCRIVHQDAGWEKICNALETISAQEVDAEHVAVLGQLAQLAKSFSVSDISTKTFISTWPALKEIRERIIHTPTAARSNGNQNSAGPWKPGVEKPVAADAGTHLDKIETKFIPPYLRERLVDTSQGTVEEVAAMEETAAETIRRAQELDERYEQQKLTREIQEHELMGGFSMKDRLPSRPPTK